MINAIARPGTLVEEVFVTLRREISNGGFAPGERLPGEQVLADSLGVSRPVLREAISQLKADGILTTRKGSGAFVALNPAGNVFRLPSERDAASLQHLFELRLLTEIAAAGLAAVRHTGADLKRMRAAIKRMKESPGEFARASAADVELHHAIAHAAHNPFLLAFTDFIEAQLLATREVAWRNAAQLPDGASPSLHEHERLYEAIEASDAVAAQAAARNHLLGAATRMQLDVMSLDSGGI